ncbi:PML-RARA-regulated adapter molecule 1 isoform X2 [Cinclus cinclus]|uniref:PML-RARA-regulated adapter molecule 1 isoform X2 n=1 Tax=Cinclus cinclus TaxID=127875 RepID=UPI002E1645AB
MMHLEGRDAVVRHLRAKFQQNRKEPPEVGGWPEGHPAASHGPEPGPTPAMASKGDLPQEPPWSRRVDCSRVSPSHSTDHLQPGCAASVPTRFPLQDAPSGKGDEDEIYDDVEAVGLARRSPGLLLPSVSQLPVYPCPRGGGNAGQASNRVTLLAATQSDCRDSQVSQKMNTMTLKACKKEEKMDRKFQKKFKFEGSINILTQMMVDPAATEKRGGAKNLSLRRGEILDVIQFTNQEQILCRNSQRRYGYVPRAVMLPLDTDIYDDVEING